mgnify:CR=1 FL=1
MKKIYLFLIVACLNYGFAQDEEVIVTSSLGGTTLAEIDSPIFVIPGDEVDLGATASLGENLNYLLGVNSTDFGPGVGQPVIRGMAGTRVKILSNGKLVRDVSGLGTDHLNDIDLNNVKQIEIVRGPSSLLYSNGAMGGIINIVDETITSEDFDGNSFRAGLERQTVNQGFSGNFSYKGNVGDANIAYAVKNVNFEDLDVPNGSIIHEGSPENKETLANSDFATTQHKFGTSFVRDWGYIGFSLGKIENTYGVAFHGEEEHEEGEEEEEHEGERIQVDTDSENFTLEGAADSISGLEKLSFFLQANDYSFTEGHIGGEHAGEATTFTNDAFEIGFKLDIGDQQSVTLNVNQEDVAIIGEEAFMKPVDSQMLSVGYFLGREFDALDLDFGLRLDQVDRDGAIGNTLYTAEESNLSAAITLGWDFDNDVSLSLGLASVARAPSELELFMNGKHLVAARVERGNINLESERSNNIDLSINYESDGYFVSAAVYSNSVDNYIYTKPSGAKVGNLPVVNYLQADADFNGYEVEIGRSFELDEGELVVSYGRDEVVGTFSSGGNVPRITPIKNVYSIAFIQDDVVYDFKIKDIQREDDVFFKETMTEGFTMVDFDITRTISIADEEELIIAVFGSNLLDERARNHTSFVKNEVPLAGRNFGVKLSFNF